MKLPALGTVVAVTWLDSGVDYDRTSQPKDLATYVAIGVLADHDNEKVRIVHGFSADDPSDDHEHSMTVIALKNVEGVVSFREKGKRG